MIKQQKEFMKSLTWYEWIMVLSTLVPGALVFKSYLVTVIYLVRMLVGA